MFSFTLWILIPFLYIVRHAGAQDENHPSLKNDNMGQSDRDKLLLLAEEIVIDTRLKQRQLYSVKAQFNYRLAYEVGLVIGKMREKYKRMNDIYRELIDRGRNRTQLFGPGIWFNKPMHFVMGMETLKATEIEIDNMVRVLEVIPRKAFEQEFELLRDYIGGDKIGLTRLTMPANYTFVTPVWTGPPLYGPENLPRGLRQGSDRHDQPPEPVTESLSRYAGNEKQPSFRNEQDLKDYYRDKFDERNGKGNNNDNWLDEYYGFA